MSHSITIGIKDIKVYNSTCNNLDNKLKQLEKNKIVDISIKNNIKNLANKLESIRMMISGEKIIMEESTYFYFLRELSTLEKDVSNLFSAGRNQVMSNMINKLEPDIDISKAIMKHGPLAIETLEYLFTNNIEINESNFNKYIKEVEEQKLSKEKIKVYRDEAFTLIDESQLPTEIKIKLKKEIKSIDNLNQIKDIYSIIQSKEDEYLRTLELSKTVCKLLMTQKFKLVGEHTWEYDEKSSNIVHKFFLQNDSNNTVKMIVDSNGQLKYKLGNYVGHACETTTNKLLEDLKASGIKAEIISIKRDYEIENTQVMRKEIPNDKKGGK